MLMFYPISEIIAYSQFPLFSKLLDCSPCHLVHHVDGIENISILRIHLTILFSEYVESLIEVRKNNFEFVLFMIIKKFFKL